MKDLGEQNESLPRSMLAKRFPLLAGATFCVLVGVFLSWGVHTLWEMDDIRVTSTFKEQMMHRKTRTMEQILDGLVRGDLRRVENSAEQIKSIGLHVEWYSSSQAYGNHDEQFREATLELIDAAAKRDHGAAKESALRLERSCIECHAIINSR